MATIDEILGRKNKQSLNRQQMQQQVYNTPAVTPAAPASQRPLTEKELEQEQGKQGEVVQLGDAKPKTPATPQTAQTPETPSTPEKPAISPDATKATMPALQQPQLKQSMEDNWLFVLFFYIASCGLH